MTRIVDFIFLIFAAFLDKKALLLSVFAFAPSVLANDIPLVTLSVENIQVRAEWNMVGDSANHFSVEGGTLMLTADIEAGDTFIATVEVRDKFSTLNPNYEDLATTVMITAIIAGCSTDEWTRNLAKARYPRNSGNPPNQIAVESGSIGVGNVIARRYTANGYNHIYLHTVSAIAGHYQAKTYITTLPSLYGHLTKFDAGVANPGYTSFPINASGYCFAEEVAIFNENHQIFLAQQKIKEENAQYVSDNAPLISGVYAGSGIPARLVTVGTAFVYEGKQFFYLYDVKLGGLLPQPNVIIDDGKAFSIDNSYPIGNSRYEYFANLTVGSDSVQNQSPHEVIFLEQNCPPVDVLTAITFAGESNILIKSHQGANAKITGYVLIEGTVYPSRVHSTTSKDDVYYQVVEITGYSYPTNTSGSTNTQQLKFADHFLCENI